MAIPGSVVASGKLVTPGGAAGPLGPTGPTAVSADAGNQAVLGSDAKIYVPNSGGSTDIQVFTTPGDFTWIKPAGSPKIVEVICIGGGGQGGGGGYYPAGTASGGGGGGGGGNYSTAKLPAALLPATCPVTVGAGGSSATRQTVASNPGAIGQTGGRTMFGPTPNYCSADGGAGGNGGSSAAGGAGGSPGLVRGLYLGTQGGASNITGAGAVGVPQFMNPPTGGAGGGGGGGGMPATHAEVTGGTGAGRPLWMMGGSGGTGGAVHAAGSPGAGAPSGVYCPGDGGGGGGATLTASTDPAGGAGGNYGGGGGGGGAGTSPTSGGGGTPGNGAPGCVVVITYF